jgi:histidine ammonia-lyase
MVQGKKAKMKRKIDVVAEDTVLGLRTFRNTVKHCRSLVFYNNDILPIIYTQGSLGASGDLVLRIYLVY